MWITLEDLLDNSVLFFDILQEKPIRNVVLLVLRLVKTRTARLAGRFFKTSWYLRVGCDARGNRGAGSLAGTMGATRGS